MTTLVGGFTAVVMGIAGIIFGTEGKPLLVVITALMAFGVMFLAALLGFFMARRQLADDLAQIRHDEHQRLHTALQSWVLGVVDSHKARLQTLMGPRATT